MLYCSITTLRLRALSRRDAAWRNGSEMNLSIGLLFSISATPYCMSTVARSCSLRSSHRVPVFLLSQDTCWAGKEAIEYSCSIHAVPSVFFCSVLLFDQFCWSNVENFKFACFGIWRRMWIPLEAKERSHSLITSLTWYNRLNMCGIPQVRVSTSFGMSLKEWLSPILRWLTMQIQMILSRVFLGLPFFFFFFFIWEYVASAVLTS